MPAHAALRIAVQEDHRGSCARSPDVQLDAGLDLDPPLLEPLEHRASPPERRLPADTGRPHAPERPASPPVAMSDARLIVVDQRAFYARPSASVAGPPGPT